MFTVIVNVDIFEKMNTYSIIVSDKNSDTRIFCFIVVYGLVTYISIKVKSKVVLETVEKVVRMTKHKLSVRP